MLLRTAAALISPELWDAISQAFTRLTPDECRNGLGADGDDKDWAVAA